MTSPATVPALLRRAAAQRAVAVAVRVDGGAELTYARWVRRSRAVASALTARGVARGDRVVLRFALADWVDYVVAYVAVQLVGGVAVPLGPDLTTAEVARIVADCRPALVVAAADLAPLQTPDTVVVAPADLEAHDATTDMADVDVPDAAGALGPVEMVYRSTPLSAPVARIRRLADVVAAPTVAFEPTDPTAAWIHSFPIGTLAAQDVLHACLQSRRTCTVLPVVDPDRVCAVVAQHRGVVLAVHPAVAMGLLEVAAHRRHDVTAAVGVVMSGGRVSGDLMARLAAAFPRARIGVADPLGHTRDRPVSAGRWWPSYRRTGFLHDRDHPQSVGRPTAGTSLWIADPTGRPAPAGELGQVRVAADGPTDPGRTAGLPTGDRGRVDAAGRLWLVGGKKPTGEVTSAGAAGGSDPDWATPDTAPVALSQEGMLWHEYFAPGCQNLPGLARRFHGPLDVDALRAALDQVVARQAALRTTFALQGGRAVQVVRSHRGLDLPVRDLGQLPTADREWQVEQVAAEAGRRPFDLVADSLFQPLLLRLADDDHVLVIRTHHMVFDDWSVGILRRELAVLYTAFTAGQEPPLAQLARPFTDFARQQRARLAGRAGTRERAFWRRELDGAPWTTQLPVEDPHREPGRGQPTGEPIGLDLSPRVHQRLRELARHQRATTFMVLLSAFGVLVQRYTGRDDLVLATVVAHRNHTDLEGVIGCFTKKVPVRLRLDGDPTFTDALARTRAGLLGALGHQDLPFDAVVQDVLGPPAGAHGLVPHLAVMFQGVTPGRPLDLPGLQTRGLDTSSRLGRAHFLADGGDPDGPGAEDAEVAWGGGLYRGCFLIVSVDESAGRLGVSARGAYHGPAVEDLLARFGTLLADVAADPTRPVSQLDLLDPPARRQMLARTRGAAGPDRESGTTGPADADEAVAADATRAGRLGATALVTPTTRLTRAQLAGRVTALADRLRAAGVGPGARVGLTCGVSVQAVVAALASWRVGAAWVGIDPHDEPARLRHLVATTSPAVVVGADPRGVLAPLVPMVAADVPDPPVPADQDLPAVPDGDAVVFHGAGPTAVPHGVVLVGPAVSHLRVQPGRRLYGAGVAPGRRRRLYLSAAPTDDGFLRQLLACLDGHVLHVGRSRLDQDLPHVLELVADGAVDVLDGTITEIDRLVAAGLAGVLTGRGRHRPLVVVAGTRGPVCPDAWARLRTLSGVVGGVLSTPPECGFAATLRTLPDTSRRPHVGRALPGVAVRVLDAAGRLVPVGAVGRLHVGGPARAAHGRLCPTGQLARWLGTGDVEVLGPVDDDRDLHGFRVDPGRIARAMGHHAGVVRVELARDGQDRARVVARLPDDPTRTRAEVQVRVWARLPGYAVPSVVRPAGGGRAPIPSSDAVPDPVPSTVAGLRALWAEVLGRDRVDPDATYSQDFTFLEALGRARNAGLDIPAAAVARNRTLGALAADLSAAMRRHSPSSSEGVGGQLR